MRRLSIKEIYTGQPEMRNVSSEINFSDGRIRLPLFLRAQRTRTAQSASIVNDVFSFIVGWLKPKFHYADFPVKTATNP